MKTFRDLKVFQSAIELMVEVYRATESYPKREWYGLAAQMRNASCSVVSNIAEGQGRLTLGEWRQFLSQARGSLCELEAQLIASQRLTYLTDAQIAQIDRHRQQTSKLLVGLLRYVRTRELATGNRQRATTSATPAPKAPSP
jgi:four helix bundle protein